MKKTLSLILAVVMIMFSVPMTASALTDGYFTYYVTDGEATITDFPEDYEGDVVVPDTLGGYPVTRIDNHAFDTCKRLTGITIPDSVTSIGDLAFYECTNLTSIKISDNMISIGPLAFYNCYNMTEIILPASLQSIGLGAFFNCFFLENVTISDGLVSIEDYAFYWCVSLDSITIPDSVTSIGDGIFNNCYGVKVYCYKGSAAHTYAVENKIDYVIIEKKCGHPETEVRDAAEATTAADGYTGDTYCKDCGEKLADGEVIPRLYVPGDATGDGKINLGDVSLVLKMIAKWDVTLDTAAADVTGDGRVNLADVSLLLKYIAKWDVVLGK